MHPLKTKQDLVVLNLDVFFDSISLSAFLHLAAQLGRPKSVPLYPPGTVLTLLCEALASGSPNHHPF